jgi:hypothetical protein
MSNSAPATEPTFYLVYADGGMKLAYSGEDRAAAEQVSAVLERESAGYVSGYQFVGRRRVELRAYLAGVPSEAFMAARTRRDLFDFAWHDAARPVLDGAAS